MFLFFTFRTKEMLSISSHFTEIIGRSGDSFRNNDTSTKFNGLAFFPSFFHAKCLRSKFHWWKIQWKEIGWQNRFWSDFFAFPVYKWWKNAFYAEILKQILKMLLKNLIKCDLSACSGLLICSMFFWQSDRKCIATNEMFFHKFQMILQKTARKLLDGENVMKMRGRVCV